MKKVLAVAALAVFIGALIYVEKSRGAGQGAPGGPARAGSAAGERVVPVTTAVTERRDVPVIIEGLGNVVPLMTVTVRPQVDGRLERVLFKKEKRQEGAAARADRSSPLLDPAPPGRGGARARHGQFGELAQELGALFQACARPARRAAAGGRSALQHLPARGSRQSRSSDDRGDARLNLDYARIVSPIDGVTGVRLVDPGNIIKAAETTGIVVVTQLDPIAVIFTLPQDDLAHVQQAMNESKLAVDAFARDGEAPLGSGTLELIDNQVNAQTATIRLKAHFPNPARAFSSFFVHRIQYLLQRNI